MFLPNAWNLSILNVSRAVTMGNVQNVIGAKLIVVNLVRSYSPPVLGMDLAVWEGL